MRKSSSHSSLSLLLGAPPSPHPRQSAHFCSSSTLQRLGKAVLAVLAVVAVVLFYLIAHTAHTASTATAAGLSVDSPSLLRQSISASTFPGSRWSDLTPPLSRESLGQATWAFLHTLAAVYPEQPSEREQQSVRQLLEALGWLYPCAVCAQHFRTNIATQPPRVGSRKELSEWLCEAHNEVNGRLDKPQVDCSAVGAMWPPELQECGCGVEELPGNGTSVTSSPP